MNSRIRRRLAACGVLLVASLIGSQAVAEVLRYSDYGPNRGTRAEALEWFADEVQSRSNGELEVEFHWGGSLLSMRGTLEGLSAGGADMGTVIGFASPRELRAYNIGDLPMENSDIWVGLRALYDLAREHPALQEEFDNAGITYVTNFSTGPIQLICRQEVTSLEDLEGMRIRASGPYGDALADLGAEIESMSQADVYQALDSGLVDCNQNYYYAMRAYGQYEVAPYVLELNWGQNMSFGVFMSKLTYDRLTPDQQEVIHAVGDEFIDRFAHMQQESLETDKQAMQDGIDGDSITVNRLSDEDRQQLVSASDTHIQSWVERANEDGRDGEAILEAYRDYIDRYAEILDSEGYPWSR